MLIVKLMPVVRERNSRIYKFISTQLLPPSLSDLNPVDNSAWKMLQIKRICTEHASLI